jgi:hypothetical protein
MEDQPPLDATESYWLLSSGWFLIVDREMPDHRLHRRQLEFEPLKRMSMDLGSQTCNHSYRRFPRERTCSLGYLVVLDESQLYFKNVTRERTHIHDRESTEDEGRVGGRRYVQKKEGGDCKNQWDFLSLYSIKYSKSLCRKNQKCVITFQLCHAFLIKFTFIKAHFIFPTWFVHVDPQKSKRI